MFGEERLLEVLWKYKDLQPSSFLRKVYLAVKNFVKNGRPQDDFTTMVVKVLKSEDTARDPYFVGEGI